jgi:hypothetical protein
MEAMRLEGQPPHHRSLKRVFKRLGASSRHGLRVLESFQLAIDTMRARIQLLQQEDAGRETEGPAGETLIVTQRVRSASAMEGSLLHKGHSWS